MVAEINQRKPIMRVAAIDLGSNTLRLLIGETDGKSIDVIQEVVRTPRAGMEVKETKKIHARSMLRILELLRRYRIFFTDLHVEKIEAVATAFSREATNWDFLCQAIMREVGIEFRSIDPDEEAKLAFLGATSDLENASNLLLIDIGGGSTEFIHNGTNLDVSSLPIGALNLTEQFIKSNPPTKKECDAVRREVKRLLPQVAAPFSSARVVAVGGTATTLATLVQELDHYDVEKVDNYKLARNDISRLINSFCSETTEERSVRMPWDRLRAEILPGGAILLEQIMEHAGLSDLTVRHRSLVHGLALKAGAA